jgi:hypothetical protein
MQSENTLLSESWLHYEAISTQYTAEAETENKAKSLADRDNCGTMRYESDKIARYEFAR